MTQEELDKIVEQHPRGSRELLGGRQMSELKKPAALQFRHNRGEGFVAGYEKEEMDKYLSEVYSLERCYNIEHK